MLKIIKSAILKVLETKMVIFFSILFVSVTTLITTLYTEFVSKKTVHKELPAIILQMANSNHITVNIINAKMVSLLRNCGNWSGGAWLVYNNKTKIINFIDVFANDPYYGGVYPTKYINGNDFYLNEHFLDDFAYQKVINIQDYDIIDMNNDLWKYSQFFTSVQRNLWKITNLKLKKLHIQGIVPQVMYLSTIKYNSELIYVFAITVSENKYCNLSSMDLTENEKMHYTGVALKKIAIESSNILNIYDFKKL